MIGWFHCTAVFINQWVTEAVLLQGSSAGRRLEPFGTTDGPELWAEEVNWTNCYILISWWHSQLKQQRTLRSVYTEECLGPGNLRMVQLARQVGAQRILIRSTLKHGFVFSSTLCCFSQFGSAVKLPGSGGAVVGLCLDQERLVSLVLVFIWGCGSEAQCSFFTHLCSWLMINGLN